MEIINYRDGLASDKFAAKFDVYCPNMQVTYRNLKLIQSKKGHHFISFPSFCEESDSGEKKYTPYIEFSKERGIKFQNEVMQLLQEFKR